MISVPRGLGTGIASADLDRVPPTRNRSLRAWDAADELALTELATLGIGMDERAQWLVVNDRFGALTVPLAPFRPTLWTDSVVAAEAVASNLAANELDGDLVTVIPATDLPPQGIDVAVIKVPRTRSLLDAFLSRLAPALAPDAVVVGAGMAKQIHRSTLDSFERWIGPTTTSLATRKARLIHPTIAPGRPSSTTELDEAGYTSHGVTTVGLPNVFSRERLDIGTRLLLDHLRPVEGRADVVDLGCGNGVVGTAIGLRSTGSTVTFTDASFLAVASARKTWEATRPGGDADRATFVATNGATGLDDGSADIVVCNPPFHDDRGTGDETAWFLVGEARRLLRPGGCLRLVGNRHLGYHVMLRRRFGNVTTVASNPKFVVLESVAGG